jgi:TonB family protein
MIAELRAKISSGELGRDPLPHIIEATLSITGAHGAAIAMRQGNSVFCTARAGSMAPDLGSELSPDSGISGQCLRTGRALRCDDTIIDPRVDAEASRRMGLRSIAVAPIEHGPTVSGILEAFSPKPYAFSDTHMELLVELAELVLAPQAARSESVLLKTGQKLRTAARNWKIALPTAAVLVSIGWLSFRGKTPVSNSSNTLVQPLPGVVVSIPADEPPMALAKPEPGVRARHAKAGLARGVVMASTSEKMRSESALESKPQARAAVEDADGAIPNPNLRSPAVGNPVEEVATAPPLGAVSPQGDAMLTEVLSPSSALPARPAVRTSQGVSGGRIERRVDPIYPPQALRARIEGRVVVQALVTEDGNVRDVKVIDGNLLFSQAAKDAVARWHFQPFRLNGQPIQITTEITLTFKLP